MTELTMSTGKCRCLRSKSSYGAFADFQRDLEEIMGATTTFWCLKTMGKAGPDEHFVHASVCHKGRSCWESADDD